MSSTNPPDAEPASTSETSHARARRLQAVFDNTVQFIGVLGFDGTVLEANRSALELIGARLEDVLGRPFVETPWWTHSPALQSRLRHAIEVAKGGALDRFEATHVAADGGVHTVDFSIKPLVADGAIRELVVEGRDITDRKRAEESLRESKAMLDLVLESIPVRVFWKDRDARYIGANGVFAKDGGVATVGALLGKTDFDLGWRAQAERYRSDDFAVMASGEPIVDYEEPQTTPTGELRWLRTSKVPLCNPGGDVVGVLGVYEDITERKQLEKRRLELETRMLNAQKLESLGLLAGTVAHDFNNLLTAIIGNAELLRAGIAPESDGASMLGAISTASQQAAHLCRQLFAYAGRGGGARSLVEVNAVLQETSDVLRVSIRKEVALRLSLAERLPSVDADATQIRQVMMNLLTNAADAIGEAPGEIRVTTRPLALHAGDILPPGPYVELVVEDTGRGMDESTRTRIFEPFFSTKGTGRGLGLATVLGIVRSHGGALEVDSAPGRGTRFRLVLPAAAPPSTAPALAHPVALDWRGQGRILLVDDEQALLSAGANLMRHLGFEVETASDGREAIDRYEPEKFSLVIVDLSMPRIDGLETMRALRARNPRVKVVLTSGYDVNDVLEQMDRARPDAFLQKPFSLESLGEVLQRTLPA